jgi:hypothetical protein
MKQEKALIPGGTVSKYLSRPLTEKRTQELYRLNMTETIEEEKKKVELKELTDTLKEQIKGHEKGRMPLGLYTKAWKWSEWIAFQITFQKTI